MAFESGCRERALCLKRKRKGELRSSRREEGRRWEGENGENEENACES
jgi:hypothetical protein